MISLGTLETLTFIDDQRSTENNLGKTVESAHHQPVNDQYEDIQLRMGINLQIIHQSHRDGHEEHGTDAHPISTIFLNISIDERSEDEYTNTEHAHCCGCNQRIIAQLHHMRRYHRNEHIRTHRQKHISKRQHPEVPMP